MPTLQDLKRQRTLTNKAIGLQLGASPSTVGMILQGRHIMVYSDEDIARLADILGVTFERCWLAMCESYNEWRGTPGRIHQRVSELRAEVAQEMQEHRPDLGIKVPIPRQMTTIESVLVVDEHHRLC